MTWVEVIPPALIMVGLLSASRYGLGAFEHLIGDKHRRIYSYFDSDLNLRDMRIDEEEKAAAKAAKRKA